MSKRLVILFAFAFCIWGCGSSKKAASANSSVSHAMLDDNAYKLTAVSDDETYGYSQENPVKVGGVGSGPTNERRFLNALLGPGGEKITYQRLGSCCAFSSPNGLMGAGLLDRYEVKYDGLEKPIIIFINMYDPGELKAPKGFTYRQ